MLTLEHLFANNRAWAGQMTRANPTFFAKLAGQQKPRYLWIGCSDSRVPANEITGLLPGELFVHRNVANLVMHTDVNCLSVLQYAVDVLKVTDVIVCGHYGCGGVTAAIEPARHGLIDNWLRHVRDIYDHHKSELAAVEDRTTLLRRLCELNTEVQVSNAANTTVMQDAWERNQPLTIHGWIYDIHDGLLKDLGVSVGTSASRDR